MYDEVNESLTPLEQILSNRGIQIDEQEHWLNANMKDINDWRLLNNMELAVNKVHYAIENLLPTVVIQDCDLDGTAATSVFLNYMNIVCESRTAAEMNGRKHYIDDCITVLIHEGKQHGLADMIDKIPEGTKFLVIPDAASNDIEQCRELSKDMDIVILDHHVAEKNPYATVVNPQLDDYPNKNLVGAGVTWQFCRAYDEIYGFDYANDFIDLAALGECGDMADYREPEVRAMVNIGLYTPKGVGIESSPINNRFLKAILEKNDYISQKRNGVNYYSLAFSTVSWINACCRSGEMTEKRLVLNAFLEYKQDELVQSSKRGESGKMVPIIDEAVTVLGRVKRRQSDIQNEALGFFRDQIEEKHLTDNAIIVCICGEEVAPSVLGLIANKIQAEYQHPTLVLRQTEDEDGIHLAGSGRNYSLCELKDMRRICEDTSVVSYAQGHDGAFGLSIPLQNLDTFIKKTNKVYNGIDFTPVYHVDYIWKQNSLWMNKTILDIADFDIYGQNVPESQVCIQDIALSDCRVMLLSPDKHPTLKIELPTGVELIKFGSSQEEYEKFLEPEKRVDIVGTCGKNEWNGKVTPQIQISDYELKEYYTDDEDLWIF